MNKTRMPFGKYKGLALDEVPRGYLEWLSGNVKLYGPLKVAVETLLSGEELPDPDEDADTQVRRATEPWSPSEGEPAVM
jgi:hypothetical protein